MLATKLTEFRNGWPTIIAGAAGVGVGLTGLPFYTFGVFMTPLQEEFGWGRSAIAAGMMFLNTGVVLAGPFIGILMDRFGVRIIALPSLIGLAAGFYLLSFTGGAIATFYFAWLAVAFLGCGTTPLTWTRAINERFDKARGLALGLTLMGTGIASIFGPPLIQSLITNGGWQAGYRGMALFTIAIVLPLAVFGLSYRRQNVSQLDKPVAAQAATGFSFNHAVKTRRFWLIAAGIFLIILGQAGATVHFVPLLRDRGIDAGTAAGVAALLGISVVVGRIVVGYLLDRFHAPVVARFFLTLPAIALAILLWRSDLLSAQLAAVLLGVAAGAEVDLLAYLVSRYFGLKNYGAIYGFMLSAFGIGAGLGPILTGAVYDATGTYQVALAVGICTFLLGAASLGFLGRYPSFEREAES